MRVVIKITETILSFAVDDKRKSERSEGASTNRRKMLLYYLCIHTCTDENCMCVKQKESEREREFVRVKAMALINNKHVIKRIFSV
jgi:hypothetical protein